MKKHSKNKLIINEKSQTKISTFFTKSSSDRQSDLKPRFLINSANNVEEDVSENGNTQGETAISKNSRKRTSSDIEEIETVAIIENACKDKFLSESLSVSNAVLSSPGKRLKTCTSSQKIRVSPSNNKYSNVSPNLSQENATTTSPYVQYQTSTSTNGILKTVDSNMQSAASLSASGELVQHNLDLHCNKLDKSQFLAQNSSICPNVICDNEVNLEDKENSPKLEHSSCHYSEENDLGSINLLGNANELNSTFFDDDWIVDECLTENCETLDLSIWQRCIILNIKLVPELSGRLLFLQSKKTVEKSSCLIQMPWEGSRLEVGDTIRIKAIPFTNNEINWAVNGNGGCLITTPDNLISGTSVVGALFCARKGILSDMFKGIDCDSKIMTVGSLVHKLFQNSLKLYKINTVDSDFVLQLIRDLLKTPDAMGMLYRSDMTYEEALKEMATFVPKIVQFINDHLNNSKGTKKSYCGTIDRVLDIEENLWIPELGLKGKIDVTIQVKLHDRKKRRQPLELKTGRANFSAEHRGQLILYIMMMRELGYEVNSGLLLYLREGVMKEVTPTAHEMRDLILLRNEVSYFLSRKQMVNQIKNIKDSSNLCNLDLELPEPINHHSACGKCPYITICSTFLHQDNSSHLPDDNPLKTLSTNALLHLSEAHKAYFRKWTSMLFLEELYKPTKFPNSQLWTATPKEREHNGKTIAYLEIDGKVIKNGEMFLHCFKKKAQEEFSSSHFAVGDYVVISTDKQINIISGYVQSISSTIILVNLDRDITLNFDLYPFHIDLYDSQSLLSFNLTNLGVLLDDSEQTNKLRKLIIDKQKPEFTCAVSKSIIEHAKKTLFNLNPIQQRAVLKVLTAKDYLLIQGMPGTGKTQTVVSLIKLMISLKKTVLITSHTHSAVDNVLLKLHHDGVDFLRLGSTSRIHLEIQKKGEAFKMSECSNLEEIEQMYSNAMIVGVTCLGSAHALLSRRKFDVCIVDESTQVLQCSVFRPLFSATKFVLIGDPEQLPPVVKSKDAKALGFDESLFSRLSDTGGTVMLNVQYRMNVTITNLVNKFTYKGLLKCADDNVSNSVMKIENEALFQQQYSSEKWLHEALSTTLDNAIKFIDTGNTHVKCLEYIRNHNRSSYYDINNENKLEKLCSNICEASIVMYILSALVKIGVPPSNIGVIAPYRDQVELILKLSLITNYDDSNGKSAAEINTVDQYQGRDKDIIIYSCTKSHAPGVQGDISKLLEGEILNDKRRLTVALTRSKQKLILIGDINTLQNYKPFSELLLCLSKEHVVNIDDVKSNFDWNCVFDNVDNLQKDIEVTML